MLNKKSISLILVVIMITSLFYVSCTSVYAAGNTFTIKAYTGNKVDASVKTVFSSVKESDSRWDYYIIKIKETFAPGYALNSSSQHVFYKADMQFEIVDSDIATLLDWGPSNDVLGESTNITYGVNGNSQFVYAASASIAINYKKFDIVQTSNDLNYNVAWSIESKCIISDSALKKTIQFNPLITIRVPKGTKNCVLGNYIVGFETKTDYGSLLFGGNETYHMYGLALVNGEVQFWDC